GDLDPLLKAVRVAGVHVVPPDRHPAALVARLARPGRGRQVAPAASALGALAEEDFARAGADGPEGGRGAPVPALPPAELLEPGEAPHDVRDVQDRRQ